MNIISDSENVRLDNYLISKLSMSRSQIQRLIKQENITVNDRKVKSGYLIKKDDTIKINYEQPDDSLKGENIALNIVYEDDDLLVVDKENGMVVHPAVGNTHKTLVNALLYYSKNLSSINGSFRPGIVHRIDAYTTGLLMVAKNDFTHEALAKQLALKTTTREYVALVHGRINHDTGTIDAPIGRDEENRKKMSVTKNGKKAVTHFKVLKRFKEATLIELRLETGRTHQIRVHMAYIGYPIVNDPVYGKRKLINDEGQCLHAKKLGFVHPRTNEYLEFTSDIPAKILKIMKNYEE